MSELAYIAAAIALLAPCVLFGILGAAALGRRAMGEYHAGLWARSLLGLGFLASVIAAVATASSGHAALELHYGRWIEIPGYSFEFLFVLDRLSCVLLILAMGMCSVVASFGHRYLHTETGHNRFFSSFAIFTLGIELVALAGSLDMAVVGWEFLGLSSALLVAYFHDRPLPAHNGLRIYTVYRVSDFGLICAAFIAHHHLGSNAYSALLDPSAAASPLHDGALATTLALLLVVAATVKCAQLPYSDWLPRAMEGPTPSSAIFYGAISVHAGVFLLLRAAPLLAHAPVAAWTLGVIGGLSAVHASIVGRAQTDVKSSLAYATIAQVGIIFIEIALGFVDLALLHACGHACLRALQFLRAPSVLHDLHAIESAVGAHVGAHGGMPAEGERRFSRWLYRYALERGGFESRLERYVLSPFRRFFRAVDRFDRACCGAPAAQRLPQEEPAPSGEARDD